VVSSRLAVLVLAVAVVGCGGSGPTPSPGHDGTPGPTPGAGFTRGELRLLLIDRLGQPWWCDPDEYPVGRDEQQAAIERWNEMMASDAFAAVVDRLGFTLGQDLDPPEQLAVYRLWKAASSFPFVDVPSGDGFRFDYLAVPAGGAAEGIRTIGIIDTTGRITVESRTSTGEPMCPICLVGGTLIDTPAGSIPVERLRVGDRIWTLDGSGRRTIGTVLAAATVTAPASHRVVRLELADGRSLTASPGHPLADGRTLDELRAGDLVDGSAVVSLTWLPYGSGQTYDLLVSGESGVYLVGGIPTASTIRPAAVVPGG